MLNLILSCLLVMVTNFVHAQTPNAVPHFYELSKGKQIVYLLGTFHAGVALSDYSPRLLTFLDKSNIVYFEKAFSQADVMAIHDDYLNFMAQTLKSEQIASDPPSPDTKVRLLEYGIPVQLVDHIDNQNCSIFMGVRFHLRNAPLDIQILKHAYQKSKRVEELDKGELRKEAGELEKQEDTASGCNLNEFFRTYTVTQIHDYENQRASMYKSGEVSVVYSGQAIDPSVAYRNRAWVGYLLTERTKGPYFAAVGAGHLYGSEGLLQLLQNNGFSVKRINP